MPASGQGLVLRFECRAVRGRSPCPAVRAVASAPTPSEAERQRLDRHVEHHDGNGADRRCGAIAVAATACCGDVSRSRAAPYVPRPATTAAASVPSVPAGVWTIIPTALVTTAAIVTIREPAARRGDASAWRCDPPRGAAPKRRSSWTVTWSPPAFLARLRSFSVHDLRRRRAIRRRRHRRSPLSGPARVGHAPEVVVADSAIVLAAVRSATPTSFACRVASSGRAAGSLCRRTPHPCPS